MKSVHERMVEKIHRDWDIFCEEAQKEIDRFYQEIVKLATEPQASNADSFIEQRVNKIQTVKRSVEEARRTRGQRIDDIERFELLENENKTPADTDAEREQEHDDDMERSMGISEMRHEEDKVTISGTRDEYGGL